MDYQIRAATSADSDEMLAVILDAFGLAPDNIRVPGHRALVRNHAHEFRVMIVGGRIVALLHISDIWIQVGQSAVLEGDVGHVSVRKEFQAQGIGTVLMRDAMDWLRQKGYHLSRLGGLMHYYSRFGFEPFLRRFVEFEVRGVHGGARQVPATEVYPTPSGFSGSLRPYDEARDWQARCELRYLLNHGRSGAFQVTRDAALPRDPAPVNPDRLAWVYELAGEVKGFLLAVDNPLEAKPGESCFAISDFAYYPGVPQAAGILLRQLMSKLAPQEPARVVTRLPWDEGLAVALQTAGITFHRIEMHQAVAGNMIQVLNLVGALESIAPELNDRFAASLVSDWVGKIAIHLPGGSACLECLDGHVSAHPGARGEAELTMTQADFVKLLFGICGFDEVWGRGREPIRPRERAVMNALFPRCQTGTGAWG